MLSSQGGWMASYRGMAWLRGSDARGSEMKRRIVLSSQGVDSFFTLFIVTMRPSDIRTASMIEERYGDDGEQLQKQTIYVTQNTAHNCRLAIFALEPQLLGLNPRWLPVFSEPRAKHVACIC